MSRASLLGSATVLALAILLALAPRLCLAGARDFPLMNSAEFLEKVKDDEVSGLLTLPEGLLVRIQYALAPNDLPENYQVAVFSPLKCGTDLIRQYHQMEGQLTPEMVEVIEGYLTLLEARYSFISTEGNFQLTYDLVGVNAVPAQDTSPANGIPDFVEKAGQYLELAVTVEVLMAGFSNPLVDANPIQVTFRSMQNYGYTNIESVSQGTTSIVLHNNFSGFPANDDPDGDVLGACKVTAAHEFKHASQYIGSRWSEGGWIELDAAWVEDLVFDQTNDYYNYLIGGSPLRHPEVPLDGGSTGTGSYEDCVFQMWMQETWGTGIVVDFWRRRINHTSEPVMESYAAVFAARGLDLDETWGLFTGWNYATGFRSLPLVGYGEASQYPSGPPVAIFNEYPASYSGCVERLAAGFVNLLGLGEGQNGSLNVEFSGDPGAAPLTLTIFIKKTDGSGLLETVDLQGANQVLHTVTVPLAEIVAAGVVIGNPDHGGLAREYELAVQILPNVTEAGDLPLFTGLDSIYPNPFNPATEIRFRLGEEVPVTLEILDVRGLRVRLVDAGLRQPGSHVVGWDGRDDAGRILPAGVYLARLLTPNFLGVSKMTLIK